MWYTQTLTSIMNKQNKWEASSGRFDRILIFYGGLIIGGFFYIRVVIFLGVIIVPITLKRLLSAKLVNKFTIDDENQVVKVRFSNSYEIIPFEQLGFAFNSEHSTYNELTLYKTYIGTRGQIVKNYLSDIVGMKWTTSWKKSQVTEIYDALSSRNINSFNPQNKDLPLWERFI